MAVSSIEKSTSVETTNPKSLAELVTKFKEHTLSSDERIELWRSVHRVAGDFLRGFFRNINEHDRENIAQDVVLKLLRKGLEIDKPESATGYIANCAKRLAYSFLRTERVRAGRALSSAIDNEPGIQDYRTSDPGDILQNLEMCEHVRAAVEVLPPIYRQVMESELDDPGVSEKDIASRLNIPQGTVKSRGFAGRRLLRKSLERYKFPL